MNKNFNWGWIGIFLSITWVTATSFLYFDNIINYPDSYIECYFPSLYDYFDKEDDIKRRDEALAYADANGNGADARMYLAMGLKFIRPTFSAKGYIKLILLPTGLPLLYSIIDSTLPGL